MPLYGNIREEELKLRGGEATAVFYAYGFLLP